MPFFRKKPVVIEAFQLPAEDEDPSLELLDFLDQAGATELESERNGCLAIHTLEGTMLASPGDYIICGVNGEFYPCKPDIFQKTYEFHSDSEAL